MKDVGKAVIVVVADRDDHTIHLDIQAGASCDVRKRTVAVVPIETQSCAAALVSRPVHAVNKKNVLPAITVVVEKSATRAQCFRKELSP
jgi:hypothetical protein